MADTARSIAALQTLFRDGPRPSNDLITPQNERDLIATVAARTPVINITDPAFGGKLDGFTDNAAAIQAAVDSIPAGRGGRVYIPAGNCIVNGPISDNGRSVHLVGDGRSATAIIAGSSFPSGSDLLTLGFIYSAVSDLTIDGALLANCIKVTGTRQIIGNTQVKNGIDGIAFAGTGLTTNCKVYMTQVSHCSANGLNFISSCPDNELVDVTVDTSGVGVRIFSGGQAFRGCHVWGNTAEGFLIRGGHIRMIDCDVETNGSYGVNANQQTYIQIIGGQFWKNGNIAIDFNQISRGCVMGTVIYDNTGVGLWLQDSSLLSIASNTFFDDRGASKAQTYAMDVNGSTDYCSFVGNIARSGDESTGSVHWTTTGVNNVGAANIGFTV